MSLRVAMYSHNGFGLGHLRRNIVLAQSLLRRRPGTDVLLVTGSTAVSEMRLPPDVDYVKLPSVSKQSTGRWRPHALDIEMESLIRLRRSIVLEAVRQYRPHLFVVDYLPTGVEGELLPALEELSTSASARTVMGFRDVLDDPGVVRAAWREQGIEEVLQKLYDLILVYSEPGWFDFCGAYGVRPGMVHHVGFLAEPVRPSAHAPADIRLVATAGSGADGFPALGAALEALPHLRRTLQGDVRCTVFAGPNMPPREGARLRAIARRTDARVRRFDTGFRRTLARSSAVVGMAGYNTVCDILSWRRPAVLVPREGPSAEQRIRAGILAARGLARVLPLSSCTPEALAGMLQEVVQDPAPYPEDAVPDLGGADAAAAALLELVE